MRHHCGAGETAVVPLAPACAVEMDAPHHHQQPGAAFGAAFGDAGLLHAVAPEKNRCLALAAGDAVHVCRACHAALNGFREHRCVEVPAGRAALHHDLAAGRGVMCSGLRGGTAALVFCNTRSSVTLIHAAGEESVRRFIYWRGLNPTQIVLKCPERFTARGERVPRVSLRAWKTLFPGAQVSAYAYEPGRRLPGGQMDDSLHCWFDPNVGQPVFE